MLLQCICGELLVCILLWLLEMQQLWRDKQVRLLLVAAAEGQWLGFRGLAQGVNANSHELPVHLKK